MSASDGAAEALRRLHEELGGDVPRIGLFVCEAHGAAELERCLDRIPKPVCEWLREIVVMQGDGSAGAWPDAAELGIGRALPVRVHRSPHRYGYGSARRAAFEYALRNHLDHAIVMRGDGAHPPEALAALLHAALVDGERLVVASRRVSPAGRAGMSLPRALGHALVTGVQNRILGLRLHDHLSGFRLYDVRALGCVPFELDSEDRAFDVEILIQLRALGLTVREVPVQVGWREGAALRDELAQALRALRTALGYRLHQLHATRDGRYLVEHGVHYTLKQSPTGSHMQIVEAIRSGSRVLDLGCSQGLLATPLKQKGVRVTGVDAGPPERLAPELAGYHRRDLELPLELPESRDFDTVVVADVIEHLRQRQQLLRGARRYLKPEGRLIISTPNVALWFYRLSLLVGRFEYGPRGVLDRDHVHLYTRATFRREVERAGFRVVRERATALPFEVVLESTGRSRLVRSLARVYHGLARLWPELFAYQFILEAEITTLDEEAVTPAASGPVAGPRA